jgi:uncharacterized membrane protein YphA (DoxX/SURF4 family)
MKINKAWKWLFNPPLDGPSSIILLRLMAGGVFLWERILKFVYTNQGVGRFTKLGLPFPQATADFVGGLEIIGGIFLIGGFLTRPLAIPFIIEMLIAILSQDLFVFGKLSFATASGSTADWIMGCVARDTFRICTIDDCDLPHCGRTGAMVS